MDSQLQDIAEKIIKHASEKKVQYCDVRAEEHFRKSAHIENGEIEFVKTEQHYGVGVRILYNGMWGFCSISSPDTFDGMIEILENTIKSVTHYSKNKKNSVNLAPVPASKARIDFPVHEKPTIDEMLEIAQDCDRAIWEYSDIIRSSVSPAYEITSKYFVNSEGSSILQNYTDVVFHMAATTHGRGITQSVDITEGGRGGIERILEDDAVYHSARIIADKASSLPYTKPVKEEKTTIVMRPNFASLLVHEILGHPSEADRVLGNEMAWAGGAWWSGKIGEKIGSEHLNVFDDPTIKNSLGWYYFDDEGVKAEKTTLVKNGILENHMQSRETAEIFNTAPTGNMRATNYNFMPLIRMACTCIEAGDYDIDEIIKDVKDGYLVSNMKVPSIDMMRYNWSISCQYAEKIKDGNITDLHRDVIVSGTAPEFFNSIDACSFDFLVSPITNCGKGDPMQPLVMGNGSPTIRGKATIKSVL
ncbi:MAG: TldD/PmbA family protein [Thaumarchaeota archaeon]|nr:TldD/PmbA family protein [Nitrososphaerota archaeon]